jgi:hypothetical protein
MMQTCTGHMRQCESAQNRFSNCVLPSRDLLLSSLTLRFWGRSGKAEQMVRVIQPRRPPVDIYQSLAHKESRKLVILWLMLAPVPLNRMLLGCLPQPFVTPTSSA